MNRQPASQPFYKSLYLQVITAILIGVLLGHFWPEAGTAMKPLGDAFIKLIKMIIAPIIFCTVVVGIAGMEDMKKVGKTGGLALLYFEVVSSIALMVGLVIINLLQPGAGMNVDASTLDTKGIAAYTKPGQMQGTVDFLLHVIPSTVVDAFAKGEILQVLLFAVLFGFALHKFGGRGTLVFDFIVLAATLSAVGHVPVAGLALILGIDRFMSEARALTNLIGNGVATVVVAKWTGDLDAERMRRRLNNETVAEAEEPEMVLDQTETHMPNAAT